MSVCLLTDIRRVLMRYWKIYSSQTSCYPFFYCITGNRWGPLIGEMTYFMKHAIDNHYFPIYIIDSKTCHSQTFFALDHTQEYAILNVTDLYSELSLSSSQLKILDSEAVNGSQLFNALSSLSISKDSIAYLGFEYKFMPFATVFKALVHSTEFVHYHHSTALMSEDLFNERCFGALSSYTCSYKPQNFSHILNQTSVFDLLGNPPNTKKMLTLSIRSVPYGWDHIRNTSMSNLESILTAALHYGIDTILLVGQSPSYTASSIINRLWHGRLYDLTHKSYTSHTLSTQQDVFRIHSELLAMSISKYHFLPANGIAFIPYILNSIICLYGSHSLTPSGPECIFTPRISSLHTRILAEYGISGPSCTKLFNFDSLEPSSETIFSSLSNLFSLDSRDELSFLRERATFVPLLHLHEKRMNLTPHSHLPGDVSSSSGFQSYTNAGVIQLAPDFLARVI